MAQGGVRAAGLGPRRALPRPAARSRSGMATRAPARGAPGARRIASSSNPAAAAISYARASPKANCEAAWASEPAVTTVPPSSRKRATAHGGG